MYGLQFSARWDESLNGIAFTLRFYEKDTVDEGSPPTFHSALGGIVRETGRQGADPNEPVAESRIQATIIDVDDVIFQRLAGSNDKDWRIDLLKNGSVAGQYWLIPDSLSRPSTESGPQVISFAATDGLAYLSQVAYANSGVLYSGRDKIRQILRKAVASTGLSLNLLTLVNWRPYLTNQLTAFDDPVDKLRANQSWFVDDDDNPLSARTVIEQVSGRFLTRFFQSDGAWFCIQRKESTENELAEAFQYDENGDFVASGGATTVRLEGTDMTMLRGGQEGKLPAWKNASSAYQHGAIQGSNTVTEGITGNGSFDLWDEGNAMPDGWRVDSGVLESDIVKSGPIGGGDPGFSLRIDGILYTAVGSHPNDRADGYVELDVNEARPAFTVDAALDRVDSMFHGFVDDDQVQVYSDGTLPGGLEEGKTYYVIDSSLHALYLSEESGGDPVDITSLGSGTHKLKYLNTAYTIEGGVDRHIIWQGRARIVPNTSFLDTSSLFPIRVQRFVVGDHKTWYAKEDGTWSIDTPYTITLGGQETTVGSIISDNLAMELRDSNGDDVSGEIRIRLYRQEDDETTDTGLQPITGVQYDHFGVLYQETSEAKEEPHTTTTTVSVNDSENNAEGDTPTFIIGDGPTAAHNGRLTVLDSAGAEILLTGGWKIGAYVFGEPSSGKSIDQIYSESSVLEHYTSIKRRFESFRLAEGVTFPFYAAWQRDVEATILTSGSDGDTIITSGLGTLVTSGGDTFVTGSGTTSDGSSVDRPLDVGQTVTIPTSGGDVTKVVTKVQKTGDNYTLTFDSAVTDATIGGTISYSEFYTPTFLRENLLDAIVSGEFIEYRRESSTDDLTAVTTKARGQGTEQGIDIGVVQAYSVQGAKTIDTVLTDLPLESIGAEPKTIAVRKYSAGGDSINRLYVGDPDDSSTASDGVLIVTSADSKRWKLSYDSDVIPTWFGAAGDGTTDDTAALQAAMDAAAENERKVNLAGKEYAISTHRLKQGCLGMVNGAIKGTERRPSDALINCDGPFYWTLSATCSMTAGLKVVTATAGTFTGAEVGDGVVIPDAGDRIAFDENGGELYEHIVTRITAVNSTTEIEVEHRAERSVSGVTVEWGKMISEGFELSVDIDADNLVEHCVFLYGLQRGHVHDMTVKNCGNPGLVITAEAIRLGHYTYDTVVERVKVEMIDVTGLGYSHLIGVYLVDAPVTSVAGFDSAAGTSIQYHTPINLRNVVKDCVMTRGAYGVNSFGAAHSIISGNKFSWQTHRNVHLSVANQHCLVENNKFYETFSTGVTVAFGGRFNRIVHNDIRSLNVGAPASQDGCGIMFQIHSEDNTARDNDIYGNFQFGIYNGPGTRRNKMLKNDIVLTRVADGSNFFGSTGIAIETGWLEGITESGHANYDANAKYSRNNTAAGFWSLRSSSNHLIKGNTIGTVGAAIYISQINEAPMGTNGASQDITNIRIQDNDCTGEEAHVLYFYEATSGNHRSHRIFNYVGNTTTATKVVLPRGQAHFLEVKDVIILDDYAERTFPSGDGTPDVTAGPNWQLNDANISGLDGGRLGQTVSIRGNGTNLLVHSSTFRLAGNLSRKPTTSEIVHMQLYGGGTWIQTDGLPEALRVDTSTNVELGFAPSSTADTNGFPYMPSMAGNPAGSPETKSGLVAFVWDAANNILHVRSGGTWHSLAAGTVSGPASAVDDNLPSFNGATGKILQDSGVGIANVARRPGSFTTNNAVMLNAAGDPIDAGYAASEPIRKSSATTVSAKHTFSNGMTITPTPSAASDVVRKDYVDNNFIAGSLAESDIARRPGSHTTSNAVMFNASGDPIDAGYAASEPIRKSTATTVSAAHTFTNGVHLGNLPSLLGMTVSDPPTRTEVQNIANKLDSLLTTLS